uniref:Uncharacterized protein n=1 Tax=Aegilops tauschii subsp. strangulata TaxID=200361 RepID=A0A453AIN2_AEGTS
LPRSPAVHISPSSLPPLLLRVRKTLAPCFPSSPRPRRHRPLPSAEALVVALAHTRPPTIRQYQARALLPVMMIICGKYELLFCPFINFIIF